MKRKKRFGVYTVKLKRYGGVAHPSLNRMEGRVGSGQTNLLAGGFIHPQKGVRIGETGAARKRCRDLGCGYRTRGA